MNALFDEQISGVEIHAAEACMMHPVYDGMIIHHESLLLEDLEKIVLPIGGSTHGHTRKVKEEI